MQRPTHTLTEQPVWAVGKFYDFLPAIGFDVAPDTQSSRDYGSFLTLVSGHSRVCGVGEDPYTPAALAFLAENEDHGSYDTSRALSQL